MNNNCQQECRWKKNPEKWFVEIKMGTAIWKSERQFLESVKWEPPLDPVMALQGMCLKGKRNNSDS